MAAVKTTKRKKLEQAGLYIGIIAGVLTIGGMVLKQVNKNKAEVGANGYFADDYFLQQEPTYVDQGGVNGFDFTEDFSEDDNFVTIG